MAKDPAMLWYWNDWHSGTVLMSRFLKGCYMDLLHAQFNHGPLSLEEIKICLGSDFGTAWPTVQKKFKQTEKGLFFNERVEIEKEKRKSFCDSRRKNKAAPKKTTHDVSYDKHMMAHMENENENRITTTVFSIHGESKGEVLFTIEHCLTCALADPRWVNANSANEQKLKAFNKSLEGQSIYEMNPNEYKKYFHHWQKKQAVPKSYQENKLNNVH